MEWVMDEGQGKEFRAILGEMIEHQIQRKEGTSESAKFYSLWRR
jgi:hypothetical protein